ncbi:MAG: metal ABC transporter ATP-binding protein [Verrucomicrobiales bacterium]
MSAATDHLCWGESDPCHGAHRLEASGLSVAYGATLALDRVSFGADCGTRLALLGPNGAGKSSLLKALAGVLRPSAGSVRWRGEPMRKATHEIAYLPQRGEVDWEFPLTVRGLVEMGRFAQLGHWRRFGAHDREMVGKALAAMEMADLAGRRIGELSGGQQQRAFIARALAQEAHVLLLDEPFTGLDSPAQASLGALLAQLASEGRLVIASHHNLQTAGELFDEALLLDRSLAAAGKVGDVLRSERLAAAFGAIASPTPRR